jgi:ABC-type multidrug transport system ATPase subunit
MRRRLDISMSLVARPTVLFLDEPTTGLDPRSRNAMWDLIDELTADGMTTLLTTQYLDEADVLAHRITVVDHGKVIAEGTPSELKARLGGHTATITFADSTAAERGAAELAAESLRGTHPQRSAAQVIVQIPSATTAPMLVRRLDSLGLPPEEVVVSAPSLDDVFFALTDSSTTEVL